MKENLRAIGCFIFGGSATLGLMKAGFNVDRVLEISDDMPQENAYHFIKNYPSTPIIAPSIWENEEYLNKLKEENYDLLMSNCPCSSLSQINRNASLDGDKNIHFYRVFKNILKIQPKAFIIENAPTLIKLGYPIIKDMIQNYLGDQYRFTIIRDYAGNHNVPMKRMRTLIVGWKKECFDGIPLLHINKEKQPTTKDILEDLYSTPLNSIKNHFLYSNRTCQDVESLFNYTQPGQSINEAIIDNWDTLKPQLYQKTIDRLSNQKEKMDNGKRYWDKSPFKVYEDKYFPSMTSITEIIHPTLNRPLSILEYARIMGYPDDFKWYVDECNTPVIQCIAQGVPANFINYIASEVKEALSGNREIIENSKDKILNFQHHTKKKYKAYNEKEINELTQLEADKSFKNLQK